MFLNYDANGNRTNAGYVTGADNRLLGDGTYRYSYDAEDNRAARFIDANQDGLLDSGDSDITQYAWDARNRLVEVTNRAAAAGGLPTQVVDYLYDVENRWIGETIDSNGDVCDNFDWRDLRGLGKLLAYVFTNRFPHARSTRWKRRRECRRSSSPNR